MLNARDMLMRKPIHHAPTQRGLSGVIFRLKISYHNCQYTCFTGDVCIPNIKFLSKLWPILKVTTNILTKTDERTKQFSPDRYETSTRIMQYIL